MPRYSLDFNEHDYSDDDNNAKEPEENDEPSRWDPLDLFCRRADSRAHLNQFGNNFEWVGCDFESIEADNFFGNYEDRLGRGMDEAKFRFQAQRNLLA